MAWVYKCEYYGWLGKVRGEVPAYASERHYANVPEELATRLQNAADELDACDLAITKYVVQSIMDDE